MGTHLVGLLGDSNRGTDLCSTTAVHHSVIPDEVANDTDGVVESTLGLVDDLLRQLSFFPVSPAIESDRRRVSPTFPLIVDRKIAGIPRLCTNDAQRKLIAGLVVGVKICSAVQCRRCV